jgi:FixJ family two-component response regulator
MSNGTIVHIVDDDAAIRRALGSLFRSVGYEARLYGSAAEFLAAELPDAVQCLVLDVRLPGISGLELQDYLNKISLELPIVLVTGFADIRMAVAGMKAGAVEFLEKPFRDQELLEAVGGALGRERRRREAGVSLAVLRERYERLSPREREVMELVASGHLNKRIAAALSIKEVTVKVHRGGMMRKMEAGSVAELARMAEILGLRRAKTVG